MAQNLRAKPVLHNFIWHVLAVDEKNFEAVSRLMRLPYDVYVELINKLIDGEISMDDFNAALAETQESTVFDKNPPNVPSMAQRAAMAGAAMAPGGTPAASRDGGKAGTPSASGAGRPADRENAVAGSALSKLLGGFVESLTVLPDTRSEERFLTERKMEQQTGAQPQSIDLASLVLNSREETAGKKDPAVQRRIDEWWEAVKKKKETVSGAGQNFGTSAFSSKIKEREAAIVAARDKLRDAMSVTTSKGS